MRIAQIAPIAEPVPPKKYGGTERVVHALTEELVRRGHEVTLFASGDSETSAKLISVVPQCLRAMKVKDLYGFNLPSMKNMGLAYAMQDQFEVIHDHNPHLGLPTANIARTKVVATWHGPYTPEISEYFKTFDRPFRVSVSKSQAQLAGDLEFAATVYNGLPLEHHPFNPNPEDFMLFIGRIDMEKGVHVAMDVAKKTGKHLIIAAKFDEQIPHIKKYYQTYMRPRLTKYGELVTWVGEVDEQQRNDLMSRAYCVLHPITWPEPFGLTLIEAMACGTPVIGFGLGAIPEIIKHGETGFIVNKISEMVDAVKHVGTIDRAACRAHALTHFSAKNMADGYEALYKKVIS